MDCQDRFARQVRRWALLVLGLSPLAVMGGCGGNEVEKGLTPVQGRVTLDGGPWPKPGQLIFVPVAKSAEPGQAVVRSATAEFDTDGRFTVAGGYGGGEGLHPGTYWVAVDCPEDGPKMPVPGEPVNTKNFAPPKYRNADSSGLVLKVEAGKATEANFDVKTK